MQIVMRERRGEETVREERREWEKDEGRRKYVDGKEERLIGRVWRERKGRRR